MDSLHSARRPADGVEVLPVPGPKITGLSLSQAKQRRIRTWDFSVMSPKPLCQPVKTGGGGLPHGLIVQRGQAKPIEGRVGATLERGLPRKGKAPTNMACKRPLVKQRKYDLMRVEQKLAVLRDLRRQIARKGNKQLEEKYERMRTSFLRLHEEHGQRLFAIEKGR